MRPDPEAPDLSQGYAFAETAQKARAMIDHPATLVFEMHPETFWPGEPDRRLVWSSWPLPEGLSSR